MQQRIKGFTLIELMIVVAAIGILASIALPTYQTFTVRAKISEALLSASSAKTHVTEFFLSRGYMPNDLTQSGIKALSTNYVNSVDYNRTSATNSYITVELKKIGDNISLNDSFKLTGTGYTNGVRWSCESVSLNEKYLPSSCRQ